MKHLHRDDLIAAAVTGLISLAVYVWTAAPNVTLLDSGEFIVAAQHFGVPHPTGYPLWTLLAWIFQLLPLGNAAWEINIFSGVCGALAVALTAGLTSNLLRWLLAGSLHGRIRWVPLLTAIPFSLMLAFSLSMWSQAVIAEVYTLHALMVVIYLSLLAAWVRTPSRDRYLLAAFFALALGFSNHHLTLALVPLPFLLILLLRRRALADWIFASVLTALLGYLGFAILSRDPNVLRASIRLFYVVAAGGILFVIWRKLRIRWRLVAFLPLVVGAGLLPYAYMPFASSTNPPMNWSYTRDPAGFFYSVNRSQYSGSLSEQTLRMLAPFLGTARSSGSAKLRPDAPADGRGRWQMAQDWVGFLWTQLSAAFTPLALIGYFASIILILRRPLPQRTWMYLLHAAFVLAAFFQPTIDGASIDDAGWWLQMPYHTYTNLIFAILSAAGTGMLLALLIHRRSVYFWLLPAIQFFPILTFVTTEPVASQRDRWFGWMYGYDMLKDLPKGAVMIGGTDPGRFVPTYMIFGESQQPAANKKDPAFDRRDLYIITQNALGEPFYMKYLRDHYGLDRPAASTAFEKWLGRENTYPETPLVLPSEEEVRQLFQEVVTPDPETGTLPYPDPDTAIFGHVLRWIWERNRDRHEFFIEESFPIPWTYDYAIPHGLVYRLSNEKVEKLGDDIVKADFAFWENYKKRLLENPRYRDDYDARRSFSKLRVSIANLYRHRRMKEEARRAYHEALDLWPANLEAILPLLDTYWEERRFDDAQRILEAAYADDPNSFPILSLAAISEQRREFDTEISSLKDTLATNATDKAALDRLLSIYAAIGLTNQARPLIAESITNFATNPAVLLTLASFSEAAGEIPLEIDALKALTRAKPEDAHALYLLSRAHLKAGHKEESAAVARRAIEAGGTRTRDSFRSDPLFQPLLSSAPFEDIFRNPAEY
ncbi:MAG: hypothetical protein Fur0032_14590 [Terrimicrobiaceae bacterium]